MSKPLTRVDMDAMKCSDTYCYHDHSVLFIHGICHPGAGVDASYAKATGTITFRCNRCKRFISEIAVANRSQPELLSI